MMSMCFWQPEGISLLRLPSLGTWPPGTPGRKGGKRCQPEIPQLACWHCTLSRQISGKKWQLTNSKKGFALEAAAKGTWKRLCVAANPSVNNAVNHRSRAIYSSEALSPSASAPFRGMCADRWQSELPASSSAEEDHESEPALCAWSCGQALGHWELLGKALLTTPHALGSKANSRKWFSTMLVLAAMRC